MKKYTLLCFISLVLLSSLQAQTADTTSVSINKPKKTGLTTKQKLIIGGLTVQQAVNLYFCYTWWWENNYHSFVMNNDGGFYNYSLGMDKVGHFYTSYVYFHVLNEVMRWGDFNTKPRLIVSTAIPILWALSIELGDGFSSYEFSPTDLTANILGDAYGLLQDRVPFMRNFTFKMSYIPTPYVRENHFKNWSPSSDYSGQLYWLSFTMHNLLPKSIGRHWPEFLNLAIGYGVENASEGSYRPMQRTMAFGIDWNLSAIKTKSKTVYAIKELLNYYHFPAPGVIKTVNQPAEMKPILLR